MSEWEHQVIHRERTADLIRARQRQRERSVFEAQFKRVFRDLLQLFWRSTGKPAVHYSNGCVEWTPSC